MEHSVRVRLAGGAVLLALVLGVSLITSTLVASRAYERRGDAASERDRQISVRGSARQRVTSDLAAWTVRVRGSGPELPKAFAALDASSVRLRAFLAAHGFGEREVEASAIETTTNYKRTAEGRETREVESYAMDRTFTITSAEVAKVASASGEVTALLKEGVEVSTSRPSFYYTRLPDVRVSIIGDAAADARTRADQIASRTGATVTEVRSVQAGPVQVMVPNSTDVSGYGSYDTSTIEKDVFVTVSATFAVRG